MENKAAIARTILKLGHGYVYSFPSSLDRSVLDRYLADKCPSKKKKKKENVKLTYRQADREVGFISSIFTTDETKIANITS